MKILFIFPLSKEHVMPPDLGLAYLATAVRDRGHNPLICHMAAEKMSYEDLSDLLRKERPDIVGVKVYSRDMNSVKLCVQTVRDTVPDAHVVLGGPHPSMATPAETMEWFEQADFAFVGEAETGLPMLLDVLDDESIDYEELKAVPGLIYRGADGVESNPRRFISDLDDLGFPAWDLIDLDIYGSFTFWSPRGRAAPLILTRGCPHNCSFCASHLISGKRIRRRSIPHVISEIEMLVSQYNVRSIDILDDNFSSSRDYVRDFCETLISRKIDIAWACPQGLRLDSLDADLVRLMERSGCYSFSVGIESGSDRILKHMNKRLTVSDIREKVNMIADNSSIKIRGLFIIGYPEEDVDDIRTTIKLAKELPLVELSLSTFIPVPGTPIYEQLVAEGRIARNAYQWERWDNRAVVYAPEKVPVEQVVKLYSRAFFEFYFRPRMILFYLRHMNKWMRFRWVIGIMGIQIARLFRPMFRRQRGPEG